MGVFLEQVELFNRAPVDLTVTFDGQCKTLKPGPNMVPRLVVQYAKQQNLINGTRDPYNPHITGAQYLVGVMGSKDNCTPLTQLEWEAHLNRPCCDDEQRWFEDKYGNDPKAKLVVHGKGRKTTANSRYDAGSSPTGNSEFSGKA